MTSRRCFILFDLTLLTLPLLLMARWRYDEVWYVRASRRVKTHFAGAVIGSGARQLTWRPWLKGEGYYRFRKNVIHNARRMGAAFPRLKAGLTRYGGAPQYAGYMDTVFSEAWFGHQMMATYVSFFARDHAAAFSRMDFMALAMPHHFHWPEPMPESFRPVRWHLPVVAVALFLGRLIAVAGLLALPLASAVLLLRKGVRIGAPHPPARRQTLFIHRYPNLPKSESERFRNMYLVTSDVIRASDAVHMNAATAEGLDSDKVRLLESAGGAVIDIASLRAPPGQFFRRVMLDYWRNIGPCLPSLLVNSFWNLSTTRYLAEILHLIPLAHLVFDVVEVQRIVFETETGPFNQLLAIEARRRGMPTVSMVHGAGGQHVECPYRFELQMEYLISYGDWHEPLYKWNPSLRKIVPCGNIELEGYDPDATDMTLPVAREGRRTIGILNSFNRLHVLDAAPRSGGLFLDDAETEAWARQELAPLFDWLAGRDDLIVLWKTKLGGAVLDFDRDDPTNLDRIVWHPIIAPLVARIPRERLVFMSHLSLEQVIGQCDIAVTTDISSAMACAMTAGVPTVSHDISYGEMYKRYHPRLASETMTGVVENLEWLLDNPLPADVFEKFNRDFHGIPTLRPLARDRIAAFLDGLGAEPTKPESFVDARH